MPNAENLKNRPMGRPKGSKNKIPRDLKEAFLWVFHRLGGRKGLLDWAKMSAENRIQFYQFVTKLLPKEIDAKVESKLNIDGLDFGEDSPADAIVKQSAALRSRFSSN